MFSGKSISVGLSALMLAGCGLTESRNNLAQFDFLEVTGQVVEAAMDASGQGRQILFLGQTPTPTRCYELVADLTTSGNNTITVTVNARVKNQNCATGVGSFRYTGNVEMARAGTYTFVVKHVFPNGTLPMTTFSKEVFVQ
jgi:hypothetical protein